MGWAFWRTPVEGKHALGPAVTAIPSQPPAAVLSQPVPPARVAAPPVAVAVAPPVPAVPVVVAPVSSAPLPETPDELHDEIARMLVTGEAFADPSTADPEHVLAALPPTTRAAVLARVRELSAPLRPSLVVPVQATVVVEPVAAAAPPARTAAGPAVPAAPSARESLAELAAVLVATEAAAVPAGVPRVELTFRDGTSTALDPDSDSSLALQQLALSLTQRD